MTLFVQISILSRCYSIQISYAIVAQNFILNMGYKHILVIALT